MYISIVYTGTQPVWTENKLYSPAVPYSSEHSIMSNTILKQLGPKSKFMFVLKFE